MQQCTVYLYLQTVIRVSGGISTHHQGLISLYLQYLALLRPLLQPVVSVTGWDTTGSSNSLSNARYCNSVIWAPDDGWRYHSKYVEQFADINKLYIVASCWTIIDTYYAMHGPLNIKDWMISLLTLVYPLDRTLLSVHVHRLALTLLVADVAQGLRDAPSQLHLVLHCRVQTGFVETGGSEHLPWSKRCHLLCLSS